jgi:hypothetical protein
MILFYYLFVINGGSTTWDTEITITDVSQQNSYDYNLLNISTFSPLKKPKTK